MDKKELSHIIFEVVAKKENFEEEKYRNCVLTLERNGFAMWLSKDNIEFFFVKFLHSLSRCEAQLECINFYDRNGETHNE